MNIFNKIIEDRTVKIEYIIEETEKWERQLILFGKSIIYLFKADAKESSN